MENSKETGKKKISNEEKKKKIKEEDLKTLSGGCGKKEIPLPKYKVGDKVLDKKYLLNYTIKSQGTWSTIADDYEYMLESTKGRPTKMSEWRLAPGWL